ncbi:DMT family transporter [Acuticoccus sp. M5D2P5]|uniref:DMT family transporter n=1 Tax=Acuticoccus kalidii TaxID=2910977 RepID=UPI001F2F1E4A|nr:DMT family transporter [Acuticoccus kalidii]MCF3933397.1 DMT family transporter [Acuticoccus kalidii]
MSEHTKGILITMLGVLAIVPDSLFIRLIDAPHATVVFWRGLIAAVVILGGVAIVYRGRTPAIMRGLGRKGLAYAALTSLGTTLFVLAVQKTSVANAVFLVSLAPVFAALVSWLFLGERLTRRVAATIALTMVGAAVIAQGSLSVGGPALLGDILAIGAAAAMASAFTVARAARSISMVPAAGLAYVITAITTLPFLTPGALSGMDWTYALILGGIFVPLGASLMALGPRYIPSAEVSLLLLLEAILSPLLVWAVLEEYPGEATILGGTIVIAVLAASNLFALHQSGRRARASA